MRRACLFPFLLIFPVACSPEAEESARKERPAPTVTQTPQVPEPSSAPAGTVPADPAVVPYKTLGWDSATSRFLLNDRPFTGVTTDYYKPSGKLKARYHIREGVYDGLVEEWYDNGQQKTKTSYIAGQHQGDNFYWNADGTLQVHKVWKDNNLISETPGPAH